MKVSVAKKEWLEITVDGVVYCFPRDTTVDELRRWSAHQSSQAQACEAKAEVYAAAADLLEAG